MYDWEARNREIEARPIPEVVPDVLARAARLWPDRPAFNFFDQGESRTFQELRTEVRRLAHGLQNVGVRHGDHVTVMLPNRIEYPIVWLALAELGAVMVPIVLASTPREIDYFLRDSESRFLVVEPGELQSRDLSPGCDPLPPADRVIYVGATDRSTPGHHYEDLIAGGDVAFAPLQPPRRDDLLNIQYTSGTTGLPKGAMLPHRFWITSAHATAGVYPQWSEGPALSDAPYYYIDAQGFTIKALFAGNRVDFAPRPSIRKFVDWLYTHKTSVAWLTEQVLDFPPRPEERAAGVKLFLGYHQSVDVIRKAKERFGAPTCELYGATEFGAAIAVPPDVDDEAILGTCGVPMPFRRFRIVRADGSEAGVGEPGELWVSGDGLLRGYWNRPDANAAYHADGWFRTGDVFICDANGYYSIVGRLKDMIRRSGENISAIEVEQVLKDMPGVLDAAVVAVPDPDREEEVKAYILPTPGAVRPPVEAILQHCRDRLAPFKVPRYLAYVDAFPYTPSEKVAKKQLTAGVEDLRAGAWDAREGVQR